MGSGVTKSALPTLPNWPDLLSELAERVDKKKDVALVKSLIRRDRLLDAAELINSLLSPVERRAIFENKFLFTPPPQAEIYRYLLDLDFKVCITTNYDQFLEKNFEYHSGGAIAYQVRTYKYDNFLADLRSPSRTILKLHGCITDPSSIILDRQPYFKAKANNPGIYDIVEALSTVNTVLFFGYSINDPDIQLILERIHARSRTDHPHYALVSKFEHPSLRKALNETFNVSFVEYPKGIHQEFPEAVKELRDAVKAERARFGIP
ncbi:SIR2 family protein [Minwuia thermotolerans]|uniref:SIR2 family protein n=1 Tax=Minwuia thermotolerans TaxID=2056226 RepID=UPI0013DE0991|nr:SIR2 family protein [Minwuia thermotolerans]